MRILRSTIRSFPFLVVASVRAYKPLYGTQVYRVAHSDDTNLAEATVVDVGEWLSPSSSLTSSRHRSMLVFGTYAADFNSIEYGQCLRYYSSILRDSCRVEKIALLLNTKASSARLFQQLIDLPQNIELWVDNTGSAARNFNVCRGWLPDVKIHPFLKLLGMMPWGLGAPETLPAVMQGYMGSSSQVSPWIQDAMAVLERQGYCWPSSILTLSPVNGVDVIHNKFDDFIWPLGSWPIRPFEKATLRLQSMTGIMVSHWDELMPDEEALNSGVLTQLGGCVVVEDGEPVYEFRDAGCCSIADFETIVQALQ